ncbi:MAG: PLP-dependent aminotransferase family protein [Magnetospirillum sp.]|nr:PLP-dependent aminotransferase family protein [Magnetospirillum sp.]
MAKRSTPPLWSVFAIDPASATSRQDQIAEHIRKAVLAGHVRPGMRLPSTRSLAAELEVSRQTAVLAYEKLMAEGYVTGRIGSGLYVPDVLPEDLLLPLPAGRTAPAGPAGGNWTPRLSARGLRLASLPITPVRRSAGLLAPGIPALDRFPHDLWARLSTRFWKGRPGVDLLGYGGPSGFRPLREAIADHLGATRAIACTADDIVITAGAQNAIDLAARLLIDPGDEVMVEDPAYVAGRSALEAAGGCVVPVPVDPDGLDVTAGEAMAPRARLALVTPSHHYPLGVPMSLSRRLSLLDWAERADGWILEDDCDGDYRYAGHPLRPLRALGRAAAARRVIYIGSFAKVLAPGLRLGFLVAPTGLAEAFGTARGLIDRHSPISTQAVLADFIGEGHFAAHLRRMRVLYAERRDRLIHALERHCGDVLDWGKSPEAGLHLTAKLHGNGGTKPDDVEIWERVSREGLQTPPLSAHYACERRAQAGFILGFAATPADRIDEAAARLGRAIRLP